MSDQKELPELSEDGRARLDIEIEAMERGITPEEEFSRRQKSTR